MMSVGRRLLLSLVPAIFGLGAAVALAYYGEYQRQAPEWFVVVALVSVVTSLVVAWRVTRHVAQRIERLADLRHAQGGALHRAAAALEEAGERIAPASRGLDELDTIEGIVDRLTAAYSTLRVEHQALATALDSQRESYATLVSRAADGVVGRLEEVRLPLHILLDNHFGELNENQEEMLGAARQAAEVADQVALKLRDIAQFDLGALELRHDLVRFADLMTTILPGIVAEGEAKGVTVDAAIAPAIPTFLGDRERLQEALGLLLRDAVHRATSGQSVHLTAESAVGELRILIGGSVGDGSTADRALPQRIVAAHRGRLVDTAEGLAIHLPLRAPEASGRRSPGASAGTAGA